MKQETENIRLATAYLMAEMTDTERDAFEERLFIDPDLCDGVGDVENDLIDEYLGGELTDAERRRFETRFLISDRRRGKLAVASVLRGGLFVKQAGRAPARTSFWDRWGLAVFPPSPVFAGAAAIAILLAVAAVFVLTRGPADQDTAARDDRSTAQPAAPGSPPRGRPADVANTGSSPTPDNSAVAGPAGENESDNTPSGGVNRKQPRPPGRRPPAEDPPAAPARIFAFTLLPVTRASMRPEFVVPAGAETVRIRVVHNNQEPFVKYRVELRNSEGDTVWSREVANKAASRSLSVGLPAELLPAGPHEVALLGVDRDGQYTETNFYNFSVRRK